MVIFDIIKIYTIVVLTFLKSIFPYQIMIGTAVLGALITIGIAIAIHYPRYRKMKRMLKELGEAFLVTYMALKDDKITEEEVRRIVRDSEENFKLDLPKIYIVFLLSFLAIRTR